MFLCERALGLFLLSEAITLSRGQAAHDVLVWVTRAHLSLLTSYLLAEHLMEINREEMAFISNHGT